MLVFGISFYLASQVVWWILNRLIWLMAMSNLPRQIAPPFVLQLFLLLGAEYMGAELDFQRGLICYVVLALSQRLINPQQPAAASSGFSFHMGGPGGMSFQTGPGFAQFGAMPRGPPGGPQGRVGGQGVHQRRRVG